ncbi:MAG: SDR family NAD(P)-dependent oxidoreductase [Clostridia bacterium]|nr:SDR family NAD(P)-dependent oxidoreductase [Clostridia bacterium]MBR2613753.1 SDR family NAD(P)-dependent oxidoreductase [Clostridia bacterium]
MNAGMTRLCKDIRSGKKLFMGKKVAISGSTGGIGRELCFYLAAMGASLILIDRNKARSEALGADLLKASPKLSLKYITADLEDINAVKAAADALIAEDIDYLLLNAGAYSIPRHKCSTGYDNVFMINFVSPYYLSRRLLPTVSKNGGRIVAVGSIAHNYSHIDGEDIDFSTRNKASLVYGNAKRHLMFSLFALDDPHIAVAHPGITQTNITAHYPKLIYAIIKYPMRVIFMRPRKACLSILCGMLCESESGEWIGPRVFDVWGLPSKKILSTCPPDEAAVITKRAESIYSELLGE